MIYINIWVSIKCMNRLRYTTPPSGMNGVVSIATCIYLYYIDIDMYAKVEGVYIINYISIKIN